MTLTIEKFESAIYEGNQPVETEVPLYLLLSS
jgi:hypothetical protein